MTSWTFRLPHAGTTNPDDDAQRIDVAVEQVIPADGWALPADQRMFKVGDDTFVRSWRVEKFMQGPDLVLRLARVWCDENGWIQQAGGEPVRDNAEAPRECHALSISLTASGQMMSQTQIAAAALEYEAQAAALFTNVINAKAILAAL